MAVAILIQPQPLNTKATTVRCRGTLCFFAFLGFGCTTTGSDPPATKTPAAANPITKTATHKKRIRVPH